MSGVESKRNGDDGIFGWAVSDWDRYIGSIQAGKGKYCEGSGIHTYGDDGVDPIRPDPIIAATAKRRLLLDFTEPSRNSIKRGRGRRSRCIASHCMALHCRMQVGRQVDGFGTNHVCFVNIDG